MLAKEAYVKEAFVYILLMTCDLPTYVYCCVLTHVWLQTLCAKDTMCPFAAELSKEELKPRNKVALSLQLSRISSDRFLTL